jgi:hypothetical protein
MSQTFRARPLVYTTLLIAAGLLVSSEPASAGPAVRPPVRPKAPAAKTPATKAPTTKARPTAPTTKAAPKAHPKSVSPADSTSCNSPTQAQCLSPSYLDSACGKSRFDDCKNIVADALKARAARLSKTKMLRPNRTQIPADMRTGARTPGPSNAASNEKMVLYPGGTFPQVGTDQPVDPATAAKAMRNPAWEKNGQKGQAVESCTEYAYEQIYDVGRFIDAAAACRGDGECVYQVAYRSQTPGIARRSLKRKDGKTIPKQFEMPTGRFPKNELFAITHFFSGNLFVKDLLYANGGDEAKVLGNITPIPALEQALATGLLYYEFGSCANACGNANRHFNTAWDWHQNLHARNKNVSDAEYAEHLRRFARFRELVHLWEGSVHDEMARIDKFSKSHALQLPWDLVSKGYFDRINVMQQLQPRIQSFRAGFAKKHGNVKSKAHLPLQQIVAPQAPANQHQIQGALPSGVLAAPLPTSSMSLAPRAPVGKSSATKLPAGKAPVARPKNKASSPAAVGAKNAAQHSQAASPALANWAKQLGSKDPYLTDAERAEIQKCSSARGPEFAFGGPISCQIGVFLRHEWKRKEAGQKSCLDLSHTDCDWRPALFEHEVLTQVPLLDTQLEHEQYCVDYTSAGKFAPAANNLNQAEAILAANKALIEDAWEELEPYHVATTQAGVKLRGDAGQREGAGNKKLFRAEFGYGAGWDIESRQKNAEGEVCRLGGGIDAESDFTVWILDKSFKVFGANFAAEAGKPSNDTFRAKGWLELVGQTVVGSKQWSHSTLTANAPMLMRQIPLGAKPSVTVTVGPVPVTMSAWGDVSSGLYQDATGSASSGCDPNGTAFRVESTFAPYISASAKAQAGVGVPGASVGVRAALNLLTLSLPTRAGLITKMQQNQNQSVPTLVFDTDLKLRLDTLSGWIALYFEFLFTSEEVVLGRWNGLSATIPLMPRLETSIPVFALREGPKKN